MHHDRVADKMLLQDMVRKSTRRLVHISTGHRLLDSIDTDAIPNPDSIDQHQPKQQRLSRHPSTLQERRYVVTSNEDEDGGGEDESQLSDKTSDAGPSTRRLGVIATSLVASNRESALPLTQMRMDPECAKWHRALYRRALTNVHQLNALGSLGLSKHPPPQAADNNSVAPSPSQLSRAWFRDLQSKAAAPPPMPAPGSYRHSKWQQVTYGSSLYLESCATRTCLLLGGCGKSVWNPQPRHAADPGTLFRIADFTDPFRRGNVFHGDAVWLRLDDFRPDLPKKRDPVAMYLNDVHFYLSWGVVADSPSGQTTRVASVLETLVPSVAHYGYDTSMAECFGEMHAPMHLAKWTIEVVPSPTQDDDQDNGDIYGGDDCCHRADKGPPDPSRPICNYTTVQLRQDDRFLVADKKTGLASIQQRRGTLSPRKAQAAQWRLCVRDPVAAARPASPTHLAGSIATKASVSLDESHRRTTTFLATRQDVATDHQETHHASRTHLAMIHHAKETHAVEYFAHKFKSTAIPSHR